MVARVLVALLGIPFVGLMLAGGVYFFLGVEVILGVMLWEYCALAARKEGDLRAWVIFLFGLSLPLAAYVSNTLLPIGFLITFGVATDLIAGVFSCRDGASPFGASGAVALGLAYVAFPMATLVLIRGFGWEPLVGAFLLIWSNDICAYLVGTRLGRHKLIPRISPKKSVEGAIGGFVGSLLVAWGLAVWRGLPVLPTLVVGAVICAAGVLGDLVESSLKRDVGVKDSGTLLPGHGGFLDRFDSTLMVMPIVYLILSVFGG